MRSGYRRLLQLGAVAAAVAAGSSIYMKDSPWWSSLAPVRFGRAATAVSCIVCYLSIHYFELHLQVLIVSADYKWNLRRLEYGTEEYRSTIKQVYMSP